MQDIANILTASELLQCLAFAFFLVHVRGSLRLIQRLCLERRCGVGVQDYSVRVDGLPADVTEGELTQFFSQLYALDQTDWRLRPPVTGAKRVAHTHNSANGDMHK